VPDRSRETGVDPAVNHAGGIRPGVSLQRVRRRGLVATLGRRGLTAVPGLGVSSLFSGLTWTWDLSSQGTPRQCWSARLRTWSEISEVGQVTARGPFSCPPHPGCDQTRLGHATSLSQAWSRSRRRWWPAVPLTTLRVSPGPGHQLVHRIVAATTLTRAPNPKANVHSEWGIQMAKSVLIRAGTRTGERA
jgi:hypothetical protein